MLVAPVAAVLPQVPPAWYTPPSCSVAEVQLKVTRLATAVPEMARFPVIAMAAPKVLAREPERPR